MVMLVIVSMVLRPPFMVLRPPFTILRPPFKMVLRRKKKQQLSLCTECGKSSTPAIDAARYGHEDCLVTAYHELGVFNERDNFGATPIHYAARFGQLACLQWLIANSGISANALAQVRTWVEAWILCSRRGGGRAVVCKRVGLRPAPFLRNRRSPQMHDECSDTRV